MKYFFYTILFNSLFLSFVWAQPRALKEIQTGKWGFVNNSGNWVIKPIFESYDQYNTFSNSRKFAVVKYKGKWGCIGEDGKYISKPVFSSNVPAISAGMEWQTSMPSSLYEVYDEKVRKWGFVNYFGDWVFNPIYDDVDTENTFIKGHNFAVVQYQGVWGCVNKSGVCFVKPVFVSALDAEGAGKECENYAPLGETLYMAYDTQLKKCGFANYMGNWAIKPIFESIDKSYIFTKERNFAVVKYNGKWGCINKLGRFVVKPAYDNTTGAKNAGFSWQGSSAYTEIQLSQIANYDDGKHKTANYINKQINKNKLSENKSENVVKSSDEIISRKILPPTIKILSPLNGSDYAVSEVMFTYETWTSDGESPEILTYINGELQPKTKGVKQIGKQITLTLPCSQEECRVQFIAKDKKGQNSDPSVILLHYRGNRPKPNLHIFAVGVSEYDQSELKLQHAAKDANDFVAAVTNCNTSQYQEVKAPILITDKSATDKNIKKGLSGIVSKVEQGDVVMLFFSGHGSKEGGETYFLSVNAESNDLFATSVNFDAIRTTTKRLKDKKCRVLIFMDACHSGALYGQKSVVESYTLSEPGIIGFYSSTESQKSTESEQWENGIFTKALLEGINGKAVDADGNVTIDELEHYIRESVRKATKGKQMPIFENKQGNFILFENKRNNQ